MPVFTVGKTEIPYDIKESARAKRMRLTLTVDRLSVTVPKDSEQTSIDQFLRQNENWVFTKWQEIQENPPFNPWPERFEPGAKVFFNGRWEPIVGRTTTLSRSIVARYREGICLEVPETGVSEADIQRQIRALERKLARINSP